MHVRIPLIALLLATATLSAQERQVTTSFIEVISVRENKSGETGGTGRPGGSGRFGAINMTLRLLINAAYGGIPTSRILDGPDWADTLRFDVDGIGDPAQSSSALLQAALRDRFALKVRRESRQRKQIPHMALGRRLQFDRITIDRWMARHSRRGKLLDHPG